MIKTNVKNISANIKIPKKTSVSEGALINRNAFVEVQSTAAKYNGSSAKNTNLGFIADFMGAI